MVAPVVGVGDVVASVKRCVVSLRFLCPCVFGRVEIMEWWEESKTGLSPFLSFSSFQTAGDCFLDRIARLQK